jgi:hypothetical protein
VVALVSGAEPALEIAVDFRTRQPIVVVGVNGGQSAPFLVDTGASVNAVDETIARAAGLVGSGQTCL